MFFLLTISCSCVNEKDNKIVIKRTAYGVPHVYANSIYDLFYGYGYVVGQDRLFQMEMIKTATQGNVAAVLGDSYVNFDIASKSNMDMSSLRKQYHALSHRDRLVLEAYAKGINAWIDKVHKDEEELLPYEYTWLNIEPTKWTGLDVALVFVGSMCYRYADLSTELENLALLQALRHRYGERGLMLFNQMIWKKANKIEATIAGHTENISKRHNNAEEENINNLRDIAVKGLDIDAFAKKDYPYASNAWLLSDKKLKQGKSMLYNGPQFGWFYPGYTYEIGLHGAGFDVVGSSPLAYPAIIFGYNGTISWGATAGFGDVVDFYQEELHPKKCHTYLFRGKYIDMEKMVDTIEVIGGDRIYHTKYKTVHGLVTQIDSVKGIAYSKKRSWEGKELQTLFAWLYSTQAKNFEEWKEQAKKMAISINWYYADNKGNIGYVFTGTFPDRKKEHDWRLPAKGDGSMEWKGFLPFSSNPQIYNPTTGFIVNWNNSPSEDYINSDMFWLAWSDIERVSLLKKEIAKKETLTMKDVLAIDKTVSFKDIYADFFIDLIIEYRDSHPIYDKLQKWDRLNIDSDGDKYYDDPSTTFLRTWLDVALDYVLKDDIPEKFFRNIYSLTKYPIEKGATSPSHYVAPGVKLLYFAFNRDKAGVKQVYDFLNRETVQSAILKINAITKRKLLDKYGVNYENWLTKAASGYYRKDNFLGIPYAFSPKGIHRDMYMNRGTQNHWVFFGDRETYAYNVSPPGQSGFTNLKGESSEHCNDQLAMYEKFEYKPMLFTEEQVEANTTGTTVLHNE